MWRFWRVLPPRGKIGIFFHSWYSTPVLKRVLGKTTDADLDQSLDDIARFEKMLVAEGALLLKFRLHISKKRQKERLQELESNPRTRWRVTRDEWKLFKLYDDFTTCTKRAIRRTDTPETPWIIVDGADERYRNLTVAKVLLDALRASLRAEPERRPPWALRRSSMRSPTATPALPRRNASLPKTSYAKQLEKYQGRLNLLTRHRRFRKRSVIAVFEGWDAAGKAAVFGG